MADDLEMRDPWSAMRRFTHARIGLKRIGGALPTRAMLDFDLACARARDAVHTRFDIDRLQADLAPLPSLVLHSAAPDRTAYLRRPDLGRRLDGASAARLYPSGRDLAIVIADGLSSQAGQRHGPIMAREIMACLPEFSVAPMMIALQARVALGDDIGERLGVRAVAMLIGERPGLATPDSLGVYMTFAPRRGRTDAERNCISNIHPAGLSYGAAARKFAWLLREAVRLGGSGVDLKDEEPDETRVRFARPALTTNGAAGAGQFTDKQPGALCRSSRPDHEAGG